MFSLIIPHCFPVVNHFNEITAENHDISKKNLCNLTKNLLDVIGKFACKI